MAGYRPDRTKDVVRDVDTPEAAEPFRATIITSLSFDEIDALRIDAERTFESIFKIMAPFVVAWNAEARISGTSTYEPLPAPAEAGWEVLQGIEPKVAVWLINQLRSAPYAIVPDPKANESESIEPTPDGKSETDSDSQTPETS
jgi:hypothetical protein